MQEKGIISTNQYVWMLFILISSVPNFMAPEFLLMIAGRDAWLSVIGGWFLDILLALVYGYMGIRFAGQNFVQYSITILGKYIGRIIGAVFPVFFLLVCTLLMSGMSHFIKVLFLPKTPMEVILISAFILVGYAARNGIEVNGRVAEFIGPLYILSIVVLSLLLIPNVEINRLQPQFNLGVSPFMVGSIFVLAFFGICIMMAMFIPHCNKPENGFLGKFIAASMGVYVIGTIAILGIAVLGLEQIQHLIDPGLALSRVVDIGHFWERVEIIWMVITIGSGIMASAIMIWAFSLGMSQIVGLRTYKTLVNPAILVSIVVCLTSFDTILKLANFIHYTFPIIAIFVEGGLEIFLFILALILKRKRAT